MDPKIIRAIYLSPHSAIWSGHRTVDKVLRRLKGKFGIKRFLRDGYRTVVEDRNRSFYRPAEIKVASCNVS
jgi:hypothetical protein